MAGGKQLRLDKNDLILCTKALAFSPRKWVNSEKERGVRRAYRRGKIRGPVSDRGDVWRCGRGHDDSADSGELLAHSEDGLQKWAGASGEGWRFDQIAGCAGFMDVSKEVLLDDDGLVSESEERVLKGASVG